MSSAGLYGLLRAGRTGTGQKTTAADQVEHRNGRQPKKRIRQDLRHRGTRHVPAAAHPARLHAGVCRPSIDARSALHAAHRPGPAAPDRALPVADPGAARQQQGVLLLWLLQEPDRADEEPQGFAQTGRRGHQQ
uniref:(northern house mosquito) hypothetical protein n=1 Tax=Culex pipiens TaxID=7175 RepID=A0A8D8HAW7_CULPI